MFALSGSRHSVPLIFLTKHIMVKKYFFLFLAVAFMACSHTNNDAADKKLKEGAEDIKEGVEMKADTIGTYLNEQKEKASAAINERKKEIDEKIEALKKDSNKKSAEARKKLEATRADLDKKSEEIKNSSAEAWEATKQDVDKALDKAAKEWQELKRDFKELFK
jgi:hypothetical protein